METDDGLARWSAPRPEVLLTAQPPVLFDEWQVAPKRWNLVRHEVDDLGGAPGRFILTGSSTPIDDAKRHTGAGRCT